MKRILLSAVVGVGLAAAGVASPSRAASAESASLGASAVPAVSLALYTVFDSWTWAEASSEAFPFCTLLPGSLVIIR